VVGGVLQVVVDGRGVAVSQARWVSTITTRSRAGSTSQDVPRPPSQPNAPDLGPSVITDWHRLQLRPCRMASPAPARWSAVSWSRHIWLTASGDRTPPPPERNMRAKASRSSAVETSPAAPSGNAVGWLHCPSGGSHSRRPPGDVA
jgi:hypothetical protein